MGRPLGRPHEIISFATLHPQVDGANEFATRQFFADQEDRQKRNPDTDHRSLGDNCELIEINRLPGPTPNVLSRKPLVPSIRPRRCAEQWCLLEITRRAKAVLVFQLGAAGRDDFFRAKAAQQAYSSPISAMASRRTTPRIPTGLSSRRRLALSSRMSWNFMLKRREPHWSRH